MKPRVLMGVGVGGAVFALLCCITPVLPWLLGAVGLSGFIEYVYRDGVLLPLAALFLVIAGYGLWRQKQLKSP